MDYYPVPYVYGIENDPHFGGYSLPKSMVAQQNKLFSDGLLTLDKHTQYNLQRLKKKLTNIDPCYEYGIQHWHDQKGNPAPVDGDRYLNSTASSWGNGKTLFTTSKEIDWKRPVPEDTDYTEKVESITPFCYLCSTLEEHEKHLARRGLQLKPKPKQKQRYEFIAPRPFIKKKPEEVPEREEVLYKIVVKTGDKQNAATSAKVSIRLKGTKGQTKKRDLKKKLSVNFTFGRGTLETFFIKGPRIGHLRYLTIEHDGIEQKHSWFLDEVEVTDMVGVKTYVFPCNQWLSLYLGEHTLKKQLQAEIREKLPVDYEVVIFTGTKRGAGTDSNVFITLYGKKSWSKKTKLTNKSKNNFEKGQKDQFFITCDDIGAISKIRIEHDNSGLAPGWFLDKVTVTAVAEDEEKAYNFKCGKWLAKDEGDGQLFRDLYPTHDGNSRDFKTDEKTGKTKGRLDDQNLLKYEVTVKTGDKSGAGTDANIYLQLFGKLGTSKEVKLAPNKGDPFERNMTDNVKIQAEDVGDLKRIKVKHDNSGLAAGWFLDNIIIKRYFSKFEISERLATAQAAIDGEIADKAEELTGVRDEKLANRRKSLKHRGSFRHEKEQKTSKGHKKGERSDSDSDGAIKRKGGKNRRHSKRRQENSDSDSEVEKNRRKGKKSSKGYRKDDDSESDEYAQRRKSNKLKARRKHHHTSDSEESETEEESTGSESDSSGSETEKRKKTGRKKLYSHGGIDMYITDSDSTADEENYDQYGRKIQNKKGKKGKYDSSDDDSFRRQKKSRKRENRKKRDTRKKGNRKGKKEDIESEESENSDTDHEEILKQLGQGKMPYCDEYQFHCERWFAKDEDDGAIERTLKPKSITTFYKVGRH